MFLCKISLSDLMLCVANAGPPMRSSTGLSPLGSQNRWLFLQNSGYPGPRRAIHPSHCEKAKEPTSKLKNVCNEIHFPRPLFLVCVWSLVWFALVFHPLEGHDLSRGLVFWGKSLLTLQGVFTGSTIYLEMFVSTYKRILLGKSMACSLYMASDRSISKKPVYILKKLVIVPEQVALTKCN